MQDASVRRYYADDHDRLDQLFAQFQSLKDSAPARAARVFEEFARGLKRHIAWEEELLFPLFERKTGFEGMGPTDVMRAEHRQIEQLLHMIRQYAQRHDPSSGPEETALRDFLTAHNEKEERILYPLIDRELHDGERQELFRRMAREAKRRTPTPV